NAGALTIGGHLTRQCTAEAGQMGAAVALRDVVRKRQHRLVVGIVPPHGYFYRNAVFLARNRNRLGDQRFLGAIDIFDEFDDTALVEEFLYLGVRVASIGKNDANTGIQEREFAEATLERFKVEFRHRERFWRRQEGDLRPRLATGIARYRQRSISN